MRWHSHNEGEWLLWSMALTENDIFLRFDLTAFIEENTMPSTVTKRNQISTYIQMTYCTSDIDAQTPKHPAINLHSAGPCITNVIATRRKNFSQWKSSFLWKLRCHWLKFLRRVAKTLVIQGPGPTLKHWKARYWTWNLLNDWHDDNEGTLNHITN